jgi:hypothetical protein
MSDKDFTPTHILAGEPVMVDAEDAMQESYNPVLTGSVGVYRAHEGYPPSVRITKEGRWLEQRPQQPLKDVTDQVAGL